MWVVKLKLKDENCIWSTRTRKWNVIDYQYPLRYKETKDDFILTSYHLVEGKRSDIERYINEIEQDSRVMKIEKNGNIFFSLVKENRNEEEVKVFKMIYDPSYIWISPIINTKEGYEIWNIGSFFKKDLSQMIRELDSYYEIKIIEFKKAKIKYMYNLNILPHLSEKQKEALILAIEEGYYDYPRKTTIEKLSKYMKVSKSTFEEHLRKAENKILKFFVKSKYI